MNQPVVVHQEVIAQLNAARIDRGVSQAELARRLGTTQVWVSRVLSGRRGMLVRDAERMARILGVEIRVELNGQP